MWPHDVVTSNHLGYVFIQMAFRAEYFILFPMLESRSCKLQIWSFIRTCPITHYMTISQLIPTNFLVLHNASYDTNGRLHGVVAWGRKNRSNRSLDPVSAATVWAAAFVLCVAFTEWSFNCKFHLLKSAGKISFSMFFFLFLKSPLNFISFVFFSIICYLKSVCLCAVNCNTQCKNK